MTALAHLWDRVTATGPVLATWLIALTAAVAFAVVASHRVWPVSRNMVTLAHEGGHAVVSIATGRRLDGIRLHSDTSGVTSSRGKTHGAGLILTTAAGYVTPSLLGVGAAWLLAARHATFLLWLVLLLLAAAFIAIRNAYGFVAVLATAAVVFSVSRFASLRAQEVFAYLFAWFLLFGGIRPIFELQRRRRRGGPGTSGALASDADQLALLTGVPGGAWVAGFAVVAFGALLAGSCWLLSGLAHWFLARGQ
ncbi:MAG TPA: M50 family metallopeptidase [Streptosporangiaceae bacterium]